MVRVSDLEQMAKPLYTCTSIYVHMFIYTCMYIYHLCILSQEPAQNSVITQLLFSNLDKEGDCWHNTKETENSQGHRLSSQTQKKRKHKAGKEDTKLTLKAVSDLEKAPRHEATLHYGIVLWLWTPARCDNDLKPIFPVQTPGAFRSLS